MYSELTFQLIVESSPNAIVLVNQEGKIAYINRQTETLFGYVRSELIGQFVEVLIPERFRKKHPGFRNSFFESPSVRAMGAGRELFALRKDNTEFPIEIGLNPVILVDGMLVLASIIDITERKKAEERFKLVVDSAPNAMVLVNQGGTIALVNSEAKRLFGYEESEMVNNKLDMLIPERFRANHDGFIDMFFTEPRVRAMGVGRELYALRKNNDEVPVEIGLNPIETDEGLMVLASIIDISERKEQEGIMKRQAELEIKNKELEQFAYIASHDLQEPLRTVSNFVQALEEDYQTQLGDGDAKKYLDTIRRATDRMRNLVTALLNYSRLGNNKKLTEVDLKKVITDTITDLSDSINNKQAIIHIGKMPKQHIYETEMRQLFQNLISNALRFQKEDTPPVITIKSKKMNNKWQFSVTDNGTGVEQKHFDRIFQMFQRIRINQDYDGYGIGLPNCKKIVELHGGEIWIESTPDKGSTFHFTISNLKP